MSVQEPLFAVTFKADNIEAWDYEAQVTAEVAVAGTRDQAARIGFKLLAGYIFFTTRAASQRRRVHRRDLRFFQAHDRQAPAHVGGCQDGHHEVQTARERSDWTCKNQQDKNDQCDSEAPTRKIAPVCAARPGWKHANQHQNQGDHKTRTE